LHTFQIQALHDVRLGLPLGEFLDDTKDNGRLPGLDGHLVAIRKSVRCRLLLA
jgi:hypothetical protein